MAFGLSGANDRSTMDDADVVVAHYSNNEAKADDYDLNARAQVSSEYTPVKTRITMKANKHNRSPFRYKR